MTPSEARQPRNEHAVKTALVLHKIHQRKYPEIYIGDTVQKCSGRRIKWTKKEYLYGILRNAKY